MTKLVARKFIPVVCACLCWAQDDVLKYPLPDPLVAADGGKVTDANVWLEKRRPEILQLFADEVYGRTPSKAANTKIHANVDSTALALDGKAIRREVTILVSNDPEAPRIHLLLYLPAKTRKPVAVFVGLNFFGNETVSADPGITLPEVWMKDDAEARQSYGGELLKHHKQRAPESARGSHASLWQVEKIIEHGYGLATAYCGDIEPDFLGGMQYGVRYAFLNAGESKPAANEWGALGAWAWGLSRIADYLQTEKKVDTGRLISIGFSRLGKASMWAAAMDTRFAMAISSESGVGGVSLYRATTAETIEHLNTAFPYWFAESFHKYSGHPDQVPVDGHMIAALIAPRLLYIASAELDKSSDPPAEYRSAIEASKVYELLGEEGIKDARMPPLDHAIENGKVGYHVRTGKHDVTAFDWDQYLAFAQEHLQPKKGKSKHEHLEGSQGG